MARFPQALKVTLTAAVLGISTLAPAAAPAVARPADRPADRSADRSAMAAARGPLRLPKLKDGIASLDVPLVPRLTYRAVGGVKTDRLTTTTFSMVGVSWKGNQKPRIAVRVHDAHGWRPWHPLGLDDIGADGSGGTEGNGRHGTEPAWMGRVSGIQVRVRGRHPKAMRLTLINTGPGQASVAAPVKPVARIVNGRAVRSPWAPAPPIYSRAAWGADNSLRNGKPQYNTVEKQVHIHHTDTTNNYTRADVPGIIRGIYRYHTQTLGWFDIAYNFLIDKFGRVWEGRSGGTHRLVRGAHTLGFNHQSVGIALIGNFDHTRPTNAALIATERTAAWKLDYYGRNPAGYIRTVSHGSDLYPAGRHVTLHVIDAHRDTNQTDCPGDELYKWMPWIRKYAAKRAAMFNP